MRLRAAGTTASLFSKWISPPALFPQLPSQQPRTPSLRAFPQPTAAELLRGSHTTNGTQSSAHRWHLQLGVHLDIDIYRNAPRRCREASSWLKGGWMLEEQIVLTRCQSRG